MINKCEYLAWYMFVLLVFSSGLASVHAGTLEQLSPDELLQCQRHRASSNDASGKNDDCFHFQGGERKELMHVQHESGVITRFWCTIKCESTTYLEQVRIRCKFDGKTTVDDVPFGMFFATGPWRVNDVVSKKVNVMRARPGNHESEGVGYGSFNASWEMPFSENVCIEVLNGTDNPMTLHFNIEYYTGSYWKMNPVLFHAVHHVENTTTPAKTDVTDSPENNFLLADIQHEEGYYAGTVLCVESHPSREGKWYEGDETFVIDGQPWDKALHGTGTEDYFGMAWGVHRPYQAYDHGVTHYERNLTDNDRFYDGRFVLYRWHISDPVVFKNSLHASIEAGHANDCKQHYESLAIWYGREAAIE